MAIELILLDDVEDLGQAGETVKVAPGYARNYLLPKGLAQKITPGALRQIEARKAKIEEHRRQELEKAQAIAAAIEGKDIKIEMQAGDDDKLFGSVTANVISDALKAIDISVETKRIKLDAPIKELGVFEVEIKLHNQVSATAKITVERK